MGANSHCFNVELATRLGLPEAILLQHFYYWHQHNQHLPEMNREGRIWFFRSVAEIREVFPYLSDGNIRTAIRHLCEAGLIVKGDYSSASMNKATWYSLLDSAIRLFDLSDLANPFSDSQNGFSDSDKCIDNRKDDRKNNRTNNTPISPRFLKPTLEEVAAYCRERGNGIDPQQFIDHYTSNGWKVGNAPMKDWRAAVRTWEARRKAEQVARPRSRYESPEEHNLRVLATMQGRGGEPTFTLNPDEQ